MPLHVILIETKTLELLQDLAQYQNHYIIIRWKKYCQIDLARYQNLSSVTGYITMSAYAGGHTLGFSHCSSFQNRIHSFNTQNDVDPSLNPSFAANLKRICPTHNKVRSAGVNLDSTPNLFDNAYYKLLLQGKSIFSSDQALLSTPTTKALVQNFAASKNEFFEAFIKSMIKMSSISGGGTEIRLNCRFSN